jgi:predicted transcriptional regulator
MLGSLEREVIAAVKRLGAATTREVLADLHAAGSQVAYTTVATILTRLHRKGLVERRREPFKGAERFIYSYKDIESDYIDSLLENLVTAFGKRGVTHLAERLEGMSETDLRRLRIRLKV